MSKHSPFSIDTAIGMGQLSFAQITLPQAGFLDYAGSVDGKISSCQQPVVEVGVWSNFRRDDVLFTRNVHRKLGPDPLLPLFQQASRLAGMLKYCLPGC